MNVRGERRVHFAIELINIDRRQFQTPKREDRRYTMDWYTRRVNGVK
jgi:hypothetical protein